ncbi:proteasome accessory factor PafA2 family protein [Candidatus Poribacteria bacterium]|jgi:hypothetical protein|nr:proteasome accessory factor PafA2 family protein [Candidatus Poribacteria bacterium]MBT5714844.1 proteasome accessory factor PafA2 family protein [Candidatus Poribacteria bacterium]MBT7101651.1 proteasome accessory factor PafA2 family protein [Candidatus Poribacteria bacterium]MBT7807692.1 proteasome accessory factor PafA2 family protein [Candidatus Poribacteria bacterium]
MRICGIETEYGCLIESERVAREFSPDTLSILVKDHLFYANDIGLLDAQYRDRGEPPRNGGFLYNGGRLYIDMGHVEYASPECLSLRDLIAYEKAADFLLLQALEDLGIRDDVTFVRNNIDHVTGATFGYHENYLVSRDVPFEYYMVPALMPFLVTRQIYAGAGRVGFHEEDPYDEDDRRRRRVATRVTDEVPYQIAQRSDHIVADQYEWVQFTRAIINTRDEPLADMNRFRRIHLLLGDTNMSEYATMLKLGTTMVVLQLLEEGCPMPPISLVDPVMTLRDISRDNTYTWPVELDTGRTTSAIEVQGAYLAVAERYLEGTSQEVDWVLTEWRSTLEALANDPMELRDRLDWVAKKWLLETFMEEEGLTWHDPWLQSLDLDYHKIDPERSLYSDLVEENMMRRMVRNAAISEAMFEPPPDTRALGRSLIMQRLAKADLVRHVDWDTVHLETGVSIAMTDPHRTYENVAAHIDDVLKQEPPQTIRRRDDQ